MAASGVAACASGNTTRSDAGSDRCPRFFASGPAAPEKWVHSLRVEPTTPYRAVAVVTIGPYERCDLALSAHIVPEAEGSATVTPTEQRVAIPAGRGADIDVSRDGTVRVRGSQTGKPSPSG